MRNLKFGIVSCSVHIVSCCSHCPFRDGEWANVCHHSNPATEMETYIDRIPSDCPLRKKATLVRLDARRVKEK